jgi:hypothetical protein
VPPTAFSFVCLLCLLCMPAPTPATR